MNKKKEVVCRVVRYCTVSMAIASLRTRSDFRSVSGKRCVGNVVSERSRDMGIACSISSRILLQREHAEKRATENAFRGL